ncbi:MAG: threonylcarbamoyl-AMP synthase [Spirochaetes bacterium GWD1_27_9]|nr:MAG: threonylcarbamoyl-AMP synthase [Spirochaetes bacterium GWB1_27_13]OHD23235.1 MAG: threonylcarbamoyl-AMP synthase [Spirochaetes bacterium GWC1_27_15]OHD42051.1 MAG: threonylcarbamoyl-AMP synthase [Spirochaetes bacterium GWD1_27_9]
MIEYVFPNSIDDRVLEKVKIILEEGGIVAYPTDTSWGVGCSVLSKEGVNKLKKLKGDFNRYTLTFMCSNLSQITEVVDLSNSNFRFIKKYMPGPYVFILPALESAEKKINMKRIEVGVRIPNNPIPIAIINKLGNPIFSITASKRMEDKTWWDAGYAEENLFEAGYELEDIREIDLIIDSGEVLPKILSTVVRLTENEPEIIRQGIGEL